MLPLMEFFFVYVLVVSFVVFVLPLFVPNLGPVVQSVISLVVKMLTDLVSTLSNSQVVLLKKMWVAFAKATHIFFFQKKY